MHWFTSRRVRRALRRPTAAAARQHASTDTSVSASSHAARQHESYQDIFSAACGEAVGLLGTRRARFRRRGRLPQNSHQLRRALLLGLKEEE